MRRYRLTRDEQARVLRSKSPKGGGMQLALYQLACCLRGDVLEVPDDLVARFRRYVGTMGVEGGWQSRIPAEMLADVTGSEPVPRDGDLW